MNILRSIFLLLPLLLWADIYNSYEIAKESNLTKTKNYFFYSEFDEIIRFEALQFKKESIEEKSLESLNKIVEKIKTYKEDKKDIRITIIGHTSPSIDDNNESLRKSKKYVKYVQDYLIDRGTDKNITVVEYRKTQDNSYSDETTYGRELSDRVMLSIYVKTSSKLELDFDNDGVVNRKDKCPNTVAGAKIDSDGCKFKTIIMLLDNKKAKNSIVVRTRKNYLVIDKEKDFVLVKSNFDTSSVSSSMSQAEMKSIFGNTLKNSSKNVAKYTLYFNQKDLIDESKEKLLEIIDLISKETDSYIQIIGHTDRVGTAEANAVLARQRATIIAQKIKDTDASYIHMDINSYGEHNQAIKTADGVNESLNRRVEVLIR